MGRGRERVAHRSPAGRRRGRRGPVTDPGARRAVRPELDMRRASARLSPGTGGSRRDDQPGAIRDAGTAVTRRLRIYPPPSLVATALWPLLAIAAWPFALRMTAEQRPSVYAAMTIAWLVAATATSATLCIATGWSRYWLLSRRAFALREGGRRRPPTC